MNSAFSGMALPLVRERLLNLVFLASSDLWESALPSAEVHSCECPRCRQEVARPDQALHHQMNMLLSRLDEQQRRHTADSARCPG